MTATIKAATVDFWDSEWDHRISENQVTFNEAKKLRISNMIKKINIGDKTILDIGCGIGQHNLEFKWKNYTGVDLSPLAIAYGQKRSPQSNYILGDVLDLPEDKTYDVIMAWDSLEHMQLKQEMSHKIDVLSHDETIFIGNVPTSYFSEAGEFEYKMNYELLTIFLINCGFPTINTKTHYTSGAFIFPKDNGGGTQACLYPFLLFTAFREI